MIRLTKSKYRLQKLFKTKSEIEEIESCTEERVMDDMSLLALKMNNTQLHSEITKESNSLQEGTQQVIEKAEENVTDLMLAAEKITNSVTGLPSISVSPVPTTQPSSLEQLQQNNMSPLSPHNKQPNPPVQIKHSKMMFNPPPSTPLAQKSTIPI